MENELGLTGTTQQGPKNRYMCCQHCDLNECDAHLGLDNHLIPCRECPNEDLG